MDIFDIKSIGKNTNMFTYYTQYEIITANIAL